MTDIAARLLNDGCVEACLCEEAAAEIERLRAALTEAETVMMIVESRSHKAEYLAALIKVQSALNPEQKADGK